MQTINLGRGGKLEMVYLEPGQYIRGSPVDEKRRGTDEALHRVTLTEGFWIGTTEVTQRQWSRVMRSNPSHFRGPQNPVERVTWNECQTFIERLNKRIPGSGFRLPTEAEWEYACRAGTMGPFAFGDDLSSADANYDGNYPLHSEEKGEFRRTTLPVGSLRANEWGLYDMHGNVWEWCQDWYESYPVGAVTNPVGPDSGEYRVYRGGSWRSYARGCRSAVRSRSTPDFRYGALGFRLARSDPDSP